MNWIQKLIAALIAWLTGANKVSGDRVRPDQAPSRLPIPAHFALKPSLVYIISVTSRTGLSGVFGTGTTLKDYEENHLLFIDDSQLIEKILGT